jgi:plasmid stabilization system protein ParE
VRLVYSDEAVADLVRLREFIAQNNPSAAARIGHELLERIEHILRFPAMGRRVEQAPDPEAVRDALFGKYVVRYLVHGETIAVLRVWHQLELRAGNS